MNEVWIRHCQYTAMLQQALASVSPEAMEKAFQILNSNIHLPLFTMGNGGSAAIADHFVCDYSKGLHTDGGIFYEWHGKATSLCSNGPLIMAISNDIGYDRVFSEQLIYSRNEEGGTALAISSSGNSKNIMNGIEAAKDCGYDVIALVGFDGGVVRRAHVADVIIHVNYDNYGVVEDAHHIIMHSLTQQMRTLRCPDTKLKL